MIPSWPPLPMHQNAQEEYDIQVLVCMHVMLEEEEEKCYAIT